MLKATTISPHANGWLESPSIYTDEMGQGWRRLVETVHAAGGRTVATVGLEGVVVVDTPDALLVISADAAQDAAEGEAGGLGEPVQIMPIDALALHQRLRDAELVDAIAQRRQVLLDGKILALLNLRFRHANRQ